MTAAERSSLAEILQQQETLVGQARQAMAARDAADAGRAAANERMEAMDEAAGRFLGRVADLGLSVGQVTVAWEELFILAIRLEINYPDAFHIWTKEPVMFKKAIILLLTLPAIISLPTAALASSVQMPPRAAEVFFRDPEPPDPAYLEAIEKTAAMVWDEQALRLAAESGLDLINVTWEDTGRFKNSSVGPNISDVTIQVQTYNAVSEDYDLTLMPVFRYPNFSDLTADISPDKFYLLVGNENGENLRRVSLTEYLHNFRHYLSDPASWPGRETSLLAKRDTHVLVSAQAAFLPVPREGIAEFNPVIFNYQSYQGDPAVLTIVATREGTSATIIDNVRDGFPTQYSWGQRLFFNQHGERATFTGKRLSDFLDRGPENTDETPEAAGERALNMVLLIQVPLKQKNPQFFGFMGLESEGAVLSAPAEENAKSDVEAAVIGHGPVEGPFTEIDGLRIEHDERFPIRVTVQFYKATSNGVVSRADIEEIAAQIGRVYEEADYVGSLVVDDHTERPTEYDGPKTEPPGWWNDFWNRFEDNTGLSREQAREIWQRLRFVAWRWIR